MSEVEKKDYHPLSSQEPTSLKFFGAIPRFLAFLIDIILICLIGIALTYPFSSLMGSLGWLPIVLPHIFILAYFTISDSSILKGRSLGKRIFSARIIHNNGSYLSPVTAFSRCILIFSPQFISFFDVLPFGNIFGDINDFWKLLLIILSAGLFYIGNSFFILFHPQKRGIHDLIFACSILKTGETNPQPINWAKGSLAAGLISFAAFSWSWSTPLLMLKPGNPENSFLKSTKANETKGIMDLLIKETGINGITISHKIYSVTTSNSETKITKSFIVHIPLTTGKYSSKQSKEKLSNKLFPLIKRNLKNNEIDMIVVNLTTTKYIGFFSTKYSQSFRRSLKDKKTE